MNTCCSFALLESALAGDLPQKDAAALYCHLEECAACSAALEQMAGGMEWCQKAASLLTDDELDPAAPIREQWSQVDFTVEHLEPSNEPNVLGRLGGYDVLEVIGHGGMGVVLKGFDRELKRTVAIKVLAPHLAHNSLAKKRFAREAQAAAAVVHPHVLAIHHVQASGRLPYLVMPLVAGESLAERLKTQGTLELKEILRIGMQAAAGLAAAHEQGLVHRDVKPANILLEKGVERAVLTDFGLARAADDVTLTRWGVIAGTPQYMSPEQARGEPLDGRSDLFSLGCVLYELATGVSPFRSDSVMATIRRLVDDPPQAMASLNPELPPWFVALIDRLLEKDPTRRIDSAKAVSDLLEACLAHVQQPATVPLPAGLPKPAAHSGWRSNFNRKGVLMMIGAMGIGLLGVLLVTSNPSDIAGQWSGDDWGTVVLEKISDTEYRGRYFDGEIQLKWSRIERRFNGTWSEGKSHGYTADGKALVTTGADRFGDLSVRLVGDEIRGALTTDARSKINPATPRLADLTWRRVAFGNATDETATVRSKAIDALTQLRELDQAKIKVQNLLSALGRGDRGAAKFADPRVVQWIEFLNGGELQTLLDEAVVLEKPIDKNDLPNVVGAAYRAILARPPTAEERTFSENFLSTAPTYTEGVKDLYRALLSSPEFHQRAVQKSTYSNKGLAAPQTSTLALTGTVYTAPPSSQAAAGSSNDRTDRFYSVVGTMEPPAHLSHVWAETSGTVTEVLVKAGEYVKQGQVIIKLDSPGLKDQIETAQALVKQFQTHLASIKASPRQAAKEAVDIAQAEYEKAQALAGTARAEEARATKLAQSKGAVTQTEIDNAHATRVAREADEKIAKARLIALVEWPDRLQEEIKQTEKQIQQAQADLAKNQTLLAACTVRAPADVAVLSLHAVPDQLALSRSEPGAVEICQIADMTDLGVLTIRAQVSPTDAARIDRDRYAEVQFTEIDGSPLYAEGDIVLEKPQSPLQSVIVRIPKFEWRLYRAGGKVILKFKLRAAQGAVNGANSRSGYPASGAHLEREGATQENVSMSDMKELQGTWTVVGEAFDGKPVAKEDTRTQRWHFDGDQVTTHGIDRRVREAEKYQYTYALKYAPALNLDGYPKIIALIKGRRPEAPHIKPTDYVEGIYKIEGDTLTIAIGQKGLPKTFKTTKEDGVVVTVLKREGGVKETPNIRSESSSPDFRTSSVSARRMPPPPVRHTMSQQPVQREVAPFEDFTGRLVAAHKAHLGEGPVSPKSIGVRFDMDERSYRRYKELIRAGKAKGAGGSFTVGLSDEKSLPRLGKLERFEDEFDPKTGAIGVYGILPNLDDSLLPGMSIRVRLNFGPPHSALEVPVRAVHQEHGREGEYVWVVNGQGIVQRRLVRTGATDDNGRMWMIEEGLSPKDMVVVEGTEGLQPGDNIGPPRAEPEQPQTPTPKEPAGSSGTDTHSARPRQTPVATVLGPKAFRDGDVVEIREVLCTSPKLEQGDSITVRGRVRLASEARARLCLFLTQTEGDGWEEIDLDQTFDAERGLGDFELKTTIKHRGVLHVTLYDQSGKPFGGVYFGTAPQMKQIEDWSDWQLDESYLAKEKAK